MSISVSDEVLRETTRCVKSFACLASGHCGESEKCRVKDAIGANMLFLPSDEPLNCPYRKDFGYYHLCTCPTHFAIHQRESLRQIVIARAVDRVVETTSSTAEREQ